MSDWVADLDPRLLAALAVAAYFAAASWVLGANLLFATRKTEPRLLSAGFVRRWWRWYRSLWLRSGLALAGWPHVVDVLLGTRKVSVATTPAEVVWEEGRVALYRYRSTVRHREPVLVVHAVVSKPWILDLTPDSSFVAALAAEGFDVFLLDWGDAEWPDAARGLTDYAETLMKAERVVLTVAGSDRVHLVGYCFGGTLCLARAAARSHEHVGSIALLAAPVDFTVPAGLHPLMTHRYFKPVYFLDDEGLVPPGAVRESFHVLRPQAIRTALGAWRRRRDRRSGRRTTRSRAGSGSIGRCRDGCSSTWSSCSARTGSSPARSRSPASSPGWTTSGPPCSRSSPSATTSRRAAPVTS